MYTVVIPLYNAVGGMPKHTSVGSSAALTDGGTQKPGARKMASYMRVLMVVMYSSYWCERGLTRPR